MTQLDIQQVNHHLISLMINWRNVIYKDLEIIKERDYQV